MLKIHEFLLSFFYFGKIKTAPGTFGSFVAMFLWLTYSTVASGLHIPFESQNIFWGVFLVVTFIYGCVATPIYTKQFNKVDHQTIVLDEVVGQILALQISFTLIYENYFQEPVLMVIHLTSSFFIFRFFDIKKPSVIGRADRMKNGVGVMLDDVLAGLFTALASLVIIVAYFTLIRY